MTLILVSLNGKGYLFCVDGLTGFREAINVAYPKAHIQRCIIHQIRSSTRYVSYTDIKAFIADLKLIYTALTEEAALEALMSLKKKWEKKYPSGVKSWEDNWDILLLRIPAGDQENNIHNQHY
jgi:putative transposase